MIKTVIYPVTDLAEAKAMFTALIGTEPQMDAPYYVGWQIDGQDVGLDPTGHRKGMTGPTPYWHVQDLDETMRSLVAKGATVTAEPKDVGGGRLIATVDVNGNAVGLLQP
jgi:predicted enzyme related to lactoylglutathione lyase